MSSRAVPGPLRTVPRAHEDPPAGDAPRESRPASAGFRARLAAFGRPPRVMGVDVARGLAVLGMIGAHVVSSRPELSWGDPSTWLALVDGRPSILFALVAGVSLAFVSGGRSRLTGQALEDARLRLARRGIVVLLIGLALEMLDTWVDVILPVYGVLFLLMIPFLGWSRRRLLVGAAAVGLLGPTLVAVVEALTFQPYGAGVGLLVTGMYPATTWVALMLAGMALGRCDLTSPRLAAGLVAGGVALAGLGYGLGAVVDAAPVGAQSQQAEAVPGDEVDLTGTVCVPQDGGAVYCQPDGGGEAGDGAQAPTGYLATFRETGGFSSVPAAAWSAQPHSGGTAEIVGSGGFALAVLGVCLLLARPLRWLLLPVATVGSMPLTAYSVHVVSLAVLLWPFGLVPAALTDDGGVHPAVWPVSAVVLLVACTAWALTLGRGPLERLTARAARPDPSVRAGA